MRGRSPLTTLGLVVISATFLAAAAAALMLIGLLGSCATTQPRLLYNEVPTPPRADQAIKIAHAILDNAPGWVYIRDKMVIRFLAPSCQSPSGQQGFGAAGGGPQGMHGFCAGGLTGNSINAAIVWPPGMTLADSELAHEMFHMWEFWKFAMADPGHSGPRWVKGGLAETKIAEIQAALRASGM